MRADTLRTMGMHWWEMALLFGAVARVTRFLNSDTLAGFIRAWVVTRYGEDGLAADFVECPWCVSLWTAAALTPVFWLWGSHPVVFLPALVLTVSYVYALLAQKLDD